MANHLDVNVNLDCFCGENNGCGLGTVQREEVLVPVVHLNAETTFFVLVLVLVLVLVVVKQQEVCSSREAKSERMMARLLWRTLEICLDAKGLRDGRKMFFPILCATPGAVGCRRGNSRSLIWPPRIRPLQDYLVNL